MTLTTKGQNTIPKDIREHPAVDRFEEHLKKMRGKGTIRMNTDEIMELTRANT